MSRSFRSMESQRVADLKETDLAFYLHVLRTISIDKCKVTCPRCTFIIEHTQKLLDKVRLERKSKLIITDDFPRQFHSDDLDTVTSVTSKTLFSYIQNKNMKQESNLKKTHSFENLLSESKDGNFTKQNQQYPFKKCLIDSEPKTDNLVSLASKIDINFKYAPNKTKSRLSPSEVNEMHTYHLKNKEKEIIPLFHKKRPDPSELTSKDKVGGQFRTTKKTVPAVPKASTSTLQDEMNIKIKNLPKNQTKMKVGEAGTYNIQRDPLLIKQKKTLVKAQERVAEKRSNKNKSNAEIGQSNLEKNKTIDESRKCDQELEKNRFLIDLDAGRQLRNTTGQKLHTNDVSRQNFKEEKTKKRGEHVHTFKDNSTDINGTKQKPYVEVTGSGINRKNQKSNKVEKDIKLESKLKENKSRSLKLEHLGRGDLPNAMNAEEMLRSGVDKEVQKKDEFSRDTNRKDGLKIKEPVKSTPKGFGNLSRNEPNSYVERSEKRNLDKTSENKKNGQQKKNLKSSTEPKLSYNFSKDMENNHYTETLRITDRGADASENKEVQIKKETLSTDKFLTHTSKNAFRQEHAKVNLNNDIHDIAGISVKEGWEFDDNESNLYGIGRKDKNFSGKSIFREKLQRGYDYNEPQMPQLSTEENKNIKQLCNTETYKKAKQNTQNRKVVNNGAYKICHSDTTYGIQILNRSCHIVTSDLRDDADIERERRALAVRSNMLARRFARCTADVKANSGIIKYALSDRQFIDKGWTVLPIEKIISEELTCGMHPAHPEFDWFKQHKDNGTMFYDSGEKLAEIDDSGRGRWFYKNGRTALQYYGCDMDSADDLNGKLRVVIYSNGCEPDQRNRLSPITVLAIFDYAGNGVVFDHNGKERSLFGSLHIQFNGEAADRQQRVASLRCSDVYEKHLVKRRFTVDLSLKYNQRIGEVLDPKICPLSRWKWHSLSDSLRLKSVKIAAETHMDDPNIKKLGDSSQDWRKDKLIDEDVMAIELDNLTKKKKEITDQEFYAYQVQPKAFKINYQFSLRIMDQATINIIFRNDLKQIKLNVGMNLKNKDIEQFKVKTNIEMEPNSVHPS